jgi:hypothetical protein
MKLAIILSWVFVALFTALNIFIFLKLKKASDQMIKMAFPNAKNTSDALAQMQKMISNMGRGGFPGGPSVGKNAQQMQAQMKAAMDMLSKMQNKSKR